MSSLNIIVLLILSGKMITDRYSNLYPKKGETLVCPICGEVFKVTDETRFIRKGNYVCDWNCFMGYSKTKKVKKVIESPTIITVTPSTEVKEKKSRKKKETNQEVSILKDGTVDLFG